MYIYDAIVTKKTLRCWIKKINYTLICTQEIIVNIYSCKDIHYEQIIIICDIRVIIKLYNTREQ